MNLIKIKWLLGGQQHPEVGLLETGKKYDVPEELGTAWCLQGAAEPETAEAHKVVREAKRGDAAAISGMTPPAGGPGIGAGKTFTILKEGE